MKPTTKKSKNKVKKKKKNVTSRSFLLNKFRTTVHKFQWILSHFISKVVTPSARYVRTQSGDLRAKFLKLLLLRSHWSFVVEGRPKCIKKRRRKKDRERMKMKTWVVFRSNCPKLCLIRGFNEDYFYANVFYSLVWIFMAGMGLNFTVCEITSFTLLVFLSVDEN